MFRKKLTGSLPQAGELIKADVQNPIQFNSNRTGVIRTVQPPQDVSWALEHILVWPVDMTATVGIPMKRDLKRIRKPSPLAWIFIQIAAFCYHAKQQQVKLSPDGEHSYYKTTYFPWSTQDILYQEKTSWNWKLGMGMQLSGRGLI